MRFDHPFLEQVERHKLTSGAAWRDRLLMWAAAVVAGLSVVVFTYLTDLANSIFLWLREISIVLPLLITPVGGIAVVWATRKFAPAAAGSGIPQVIVGLDTSLPPAQARQVVSLKLSAFKAFLGSLAMAVGFSTGREGPSVQIAAGVMQAFRRGFGERAFLHERDLILAGGAAGIAAAFNAPLAGIVFAIEELSRRFEQRSSGVILTAIILGGIVSIALQGNFTYFGHLNVRNLELSLFFPAALCALGAGVVGGLFSRLLLVSAGSTSGYFSQLKLRHPVLFAGGCGLAIAVLGCISQGAAHGSGAEYAKEVLAGEHNLPFLYVVVKFVSTLLTYWSGVPGGIFAPALSIGAGWGNDIAILFHLPAGVPLIAIGMVGFLAAVTQAPITAFVIVMEMIDGHTMVLSLMAAALSASLISRLISPPLYHSLAAMQRQRLNAEVQPSIPLSDTASSTHTSHK